MIALALMFVLPMTLLLLFKGGDPDAITPLEAFIGGFEYTPASRKFDYTAQKRIPDYRAPDRDFDYSAQER